MTSRVFRAQDAWGRMVAVKELLPEHREDPRRVKSLAREARLQQGFLHPHAVRLLRFDAEEHRLVLELLPRSLRTALAEDPFHLERRIRWAMDITGVLGELHARRLVHRDLKPENIFLTEKGLAKLGDFGFTQAEPGPLGRLRSLLGRERIQGTPAYLSPEQVRRQIPTARSDVFSWGMVLYEMFAGIHPFRSPGPPRAEDPALFQHILYEPARPLREHRKEIPKGLESLVLACLSKQVDERPTATALLAGLRSL